MTTIIIDWDDTVCPSTHMSLLGYHPDDSIDEKTHSHLRALDAIAVRFIEVAQNHGNVFIVTNANLSWVHLAGAKFIPQVLKKLETIPIISARDRYEPTHPALEWKKHAFGDVVRTTFPKALISIGDLQAERYAAMSFKNILLVKNLKLVEKPTISQIIQQLSFLIQNFCKIYTVPHDLDTMLTVSFPSVP